MMARKDAPQKDLQSKTSVKNPAGVRKDDAPAENLDTVRELLFGNTARAFEENIAAVEERLKNRIVATQQTSDKSIEKLQTNTTQAIAALESSSSSEKQRQTDELLALESKVDALFNGLNSDLSALVRRTTTSESNLHELIKSELTQLREQMQIQFSSLENKTSRELESARSDSVSRDSLAALLSSALDEIRNPSVPVQLRKTGS